MPRVFLFYGRVVLQPRRFITPFQGFGVKNDFSSLPLTYRVIQQQILLRLILSY